MVELIFQSTLSWGERHWPLRIGNKQSDFNPRSPGESDLIIRQIIQTHPISIHALLGRATVPGQSRGPGRNHFNPRSPGESDGHSIKCNSQSHNFNPRSPGESDRTHHTQLHNMSISIHALLGRATQTQTMT